MLPTFMPVATQAAIKGLTSQQTEALGVSLILNNTYHLNLRPGINILNQVGGAHAFQGWTRNLLTVRHQRRIALLGTHATYRIAEASSWSRSAHSRRSPRRARSSRARSMAK